MTERRAMEEFEARFGDRVRAYTDPATERRIDALAISRTAMSSRRATGWSRHRLGGGWLGRPIAGVPLAVALGTVVVIGVVGVGILGRPSISPTASPAASAGGPIPVVLRHSWQRPQPVAPGPDPWGTGFLSLASGPMDFGREPGAAASRSAITAAGLDTLVVTATAETKGCAIGDIGTYRWSVAGKGTVLTLTAIGADACPAREQALAGPWVRSDLPLPAGGGVTLPPGRHETSAFDPFDRPRVSGQLSYTVPDGWTVEDDQPTTIVLHHFHDASPGRPATDSFIGLFTQPRMAADFASGAICGPFSEAPGVGRGVGDLVAAIRARPGVVSTPPAAVTIGGYEGQMLDLHLAPAWIGGCRAPEGPIVGMPILLEAGSGPSVGISPAHPLRVILLDLTGGRTMAVAIYGVEPSQASSFDAQVAEAMPIIESFAFHPPGP